MKKLFAFFWDKSLLIFAIIGAVNTVITMVGTQLLMGPFTNLWGENAAYWASSATMFFLTSIEAFFLNRHFSFESKAPMGKSAVRFAPVVAVCYVQYVEVAGAHFHPCVPAAVRGQRLGAAHRPSGGAGDIHRVQLSGPAPVGLQGVNSAQGAVSLAAGPAPSGVG